ncbi:hypothetical protein AMJ47_03565 [Parcubacteria bacterium DG_72]|nr:MAG: hypothetical protein AMJ47_03565 [Parcubacteria bacterium DG_72]
MEPLRKKTLLFHVFGAIFTIFLGSFFHFIYELSGFFKPVALIGAVNESTWEHLKIAFWPAFIFAIIEYFSYGKNQKNFYFAKAKELYIIPFLIIVFFYGYAVFIEHNLFLDIFIFVLAIIIGYIVSYKILVWQRDFSKYKILAVGLIIIAVVAFSLLSYFPIENFLFLDPVIGSYGIIK